MKKQDLLNYIKDIKENTDIILNVGNEMYYSKMSGKYRGAFLDPEANIIILNFDELKKE